MNTTGDSAAPSPNGIGGQRAPFMDLLSIRPFPDDSGQIAFELIIEEKHLRSLGILHGGVTATLLDMALGYAAGRLAPEGHHVVTVQLNINYIRPAWLGETLIARGEVRHAGQQTAVSRGELRTVDNNLVAAASGTFMYLPLPRTADKVMPRHDETERCITDW